MRRVDQGEFSDGCVADASRAHGRETQRDWTALRLGRVIQGGDFGFDPERTSNEILYSDVALVGVSVLIDDEFALTQLKWALQALAQPSATQIALFPEYVIVADELTFDFDNWYRATKWRERFTAAQSATLEAVDALLDQMSLARDPELWTEKALTERPEWREARDLAQQALQSLDWEFGAPPRDRSAYVRAKSDA